MFSGLMYLGSALVNEARSPTEVLHHMASLNELYMKRAAAASQPLSESSSDASGLHAGISLLLAVPFRSTDSLKLFIEDDQSGQSSATDVGQVKAQSQNVQGSENSGPGPQAADSKQAAISEESAAEAAGQKEPSAAVQHSELASFPMRRVVFAVRGSHSHSLCFAFTVVFDRDLFQCHVLRCPDANTVSVQNRFFF